MRCVLGTVDERSLGVWKGDATLQKSNDRMMADFMVGATGCGASLPDVFFVICHSCRDPPIVQRRCCC